jgi:hypothetical protein
MELTKKRRFALSEAAFRKLCAWVKQRDCELAAAYREIIGINPPYPGEDAEVHHVIHKGSGGPDREENLIHLAYGVHRYQVHGDDPGLSRDLTMRMTAYLKSSAVRAWRYRHSQGLDHIYLAAEREQLAHKRKVNMPNLKRWSYV